QIENYQDLANRIHGRPLFQRLPTPEMGAIGPRHLPENGRWIARTASVFPRDMRDGIMPRRLAPVNRSSLWHERRRFLPQLLQPGPQLLPADPQVMGVEQLPHPQRLKITQLIDEFALGRRLALNQMIQPGLELLALVVLQAVQPNRDRFL